MSEFLDGLDKTLTVLVKANQRLPVRVEVAPDIYDDLRLRVPLSADKALTTTGMEIIVNAALPPGQWRFPDQQPIMSIKT